MVSRKLQLACSTRMRKSFSRNMKKSLTGQNPYTSLEHEVSNMPTSEQLYYPRANRVHAGTVSSFSAEKQAVCEVLRPLLRTRGSQSSLEVASRAQDRPRLRSRKRTKTPTCSKNRHHCLRRLYRTCRRPQRYHRSEVVSGSLYRLARPKHVGTVQVVVD